jgi:hypothetical protein
MSRTRAYARVAVWAGVVAALLSGSVLAGDYSISVVADGLASPTGITVRGSGIVIFTEIPTPGEGGGANGVKSLDLVSGTITTLHTGEPEPVNIALGPGNNLYWTCRSAGVILRRAPDGTVTPFLTDLQQPSGISVDRGGNVYFTQLPTPGVPGSEGGTNTVSVFDGAMTTVLTTGEPEPTDIVVSRNGTAYWTCRSAGVILQRTPDGTVSLLLGGLNKPKGIALDQRGEHLYFTEVPTPGVPGSMGGGNFVWKVDLATRARTIVHFGDPEPTDVAVAKNGKVYWTCTSAGVIVEATPSETP